MSAAPEAERLHRDIHPAELLLPDGSLHRDLRVFVTSRRLLAYRVTDGRIVQSHDLAVSEPCSVPRDRGSLRGRLEVRLADGQTAWVNRGAGCGCASPLKALGSPVAW